MDDREAVAAANNAFYRALEGLDLAAMEALWLHEPFARCIHPGSEALVGWDRIRASWEQIFAHTRWLRVSATDVWIQALGELAVVCCSENITSSDDGDVGVAVAAATNVYLRTGSGWRMIHHHASPAPVHVTHPFSGIVQ